MVKWQQGNMEKRKKERKGEIDRESERVWYKYVDGEKEDGVE